MNRRSEQITHHAFKPTACHYIAVWLNSEVTVTAMAAVVNGIRVTVFGNLEQSLFIEKKCPQMVFQIEDGTRVFVLREFLPDAFKKIAILLGGNMCGFLLRRGAVPPEGENIHPLFHHKIDYVRNFVDVGS